MSEVETDRRVPGDHARSPRLCAPVWRMAALVAALACAGCAGAPRQRAIEGGPVDTGPTSIAAARKYLEGRWTLESYRIFPAGQASIPLTGSGTLLYDAYGNLDMEIRADAATARVLDRAGIPSDNGVISARGRAAVDMQSRTLTYVLEAPPAPGAPSGPLALNRARHWVVDGAILTLTTKGDDGRILSEGRWRKLP